MAKTKIIPPTPELPKIRVVNIEEVLTQRRNTNRAKPGGDEAIERSIRKFGAVRPGAASINENGDVEMFAGSHALKSAQAAGFSEVLLIPHDGTRYPVLVRTDLDPERDAGLIQEASLADNQTHELSYEIDFEVAEQLAEEFSFDLEDWGVVAPGEIGDLDGFFQSDPNGHQPKEDGFSITLNYSEDEYRVVKDALSKVAKTPGQAVWSLLNLGE